MSFAITCSECGSEVPFSIGVTGDTMPLTETCDCGAVWQIHSHLVVPQDDG